MKTQLVLVCTLAYFAHAQQVQPPPSTVCQCSEFEPCVARAEQVLQRCMYESCTGQLSTQNRAFVQCGRAAQNENTQWQACLNDITGKPCQGASSNQNFVPPFTARLHALRQRRSKRQAGFGGQDEEENNWFSGILNMLGIKTQEWENYGNCLSQCLEASGGQGPQPQTMAAGYFGNPESYDRCAAQLNCRPLAINWANYPAATQICGERIGSKWRDTFLASCKCYETAAKMTTSPTAQSSFQRQQTGDSSMCTMLASWMADEDSVPQQPQQPFQFNNPQRG